jgi:hypothetical protein
MSTSARLLALVALTALGSGASANPVVNPPVVPSPPAYVWQDGRSDWQAPARTARWRLAEPSLPCPDLVVAGCEVGEFGARADGVTDDTAAFQSALLFMAENGGGTVWVPAGRYAIRGTLTVPVNVTLRGDWAPPAGEPRGSILLAYAGRGSAAGKPFLTVYPNAGVRGLTIYYPEQDAEAPVPYPWTIHRPDLNGFKPCMTVEDVTVLNAWCGIQIGTPVTGNTNWLVRNVFITAIASGIETDMTNDTGRLYNVTVSPRFWRESRVLGAPSRPDAPALQAMRLSGVGITLRRHDFTHHGPFTIDGYAIGLKGEASRTDRHEGDFATYGTSHFQGHFYGVEIRDCTVAAHLSGLHPASVAFTDSVLIGHEVGVRVEATPDAAVLFNRCTVGGATAIDNRGLWALSALACDLRGPVRQGAGALALVGGSLQVQAGVPAVWLEAERTGVTLQGVEGLEHAQVQGPGAQSPFAFDAAALPPASPARARLEVTPPCPLKPAGRRLAVFDEMGAEGERDISAALQSRLDALAAQGGGIVFLPPGIYRLEHPVRVPAGVELRGANEGPHHMAKSATLVQVFWGKGTPEAAAALSLEAGAGLRGIGFVYPEKDYRELADFAWLIRGLGKGVYVVNVAVGGVDRLLDLASACCDDHYVDHLFANPLRVGVAVGAGSTGGKVLNCQFITHAWSLIHVVWSDAAIRRLHAPDPDRVPKMEWQDEPQGKAHADILRANLRAFVLEAVSDQTLFFNFIYGTLSALDAGFSGRGPEGAVFHHGSDVCINGARIRATGPRGLELVNYMVYANHWENATGLSVEGPDVRLSVRSPQWAGPMSRALHLNGGTVSIEQPLFSISGRHGPWVDQGRLDLQAPVFFYYETNPRLLVGPSALGSGLGALSAAPLLTQTHPDRQPAEDRFPWRGNTVAPKLP